MPLTPHLALHSNHPRPRWDLFYLKFSFSSCREESDREYRWNLSLVEAKWRHFSADYIVLCILKLPLLIECGVNWHLPYNERWRGIHVTFVSRITLPRTNTKPLKKIKARSPHDTRHDVVLCPKFHFNCQQIKNLQIYFLVIVRSVCLIGKSNKQLKH